jgi:hypothetical protein
MEGEIAGNKEALGDSADGFRDPHAPGLGVALRLGEMEGAVEKKKTGK